MYQIPIQVPGLKRRRRSIGLLHLLAGFFLLANAQNVLRVLDLKSYWPLLPLFAVALASLFYGGFRRKLDPAARFNTPLRLLQLPTFLTLALVLAANGQTGKSVGLFLWVLISGMLALTERVALQPQQLSIHTQGIAYPSGYTFKNIPWSAVADITVRPDLLTIHYPDNRFLQLEPQQPLADAQVTQMQEFCRRQMAAGQLN